MIRPTKLAVAAATVAATTIAGLAVATKSHASHPTASSPVVAKTEAGDVHARDWGLVINIKNDSSYPLTFLKADGRDPQSAPKAVLQPGDTDRLAYKSDSTGMSVRLYYKVGDTAETVYPIFSVPFMGGNATGCTVNDISAKSPVGPRCDIGTGWEPDAHVTFFNRKAS